LLGDAEVRPHLSYRFLYGNGIQATPGQPQTTAVHSLAPGILLRLGSVWSFDYTLNQSLYSNQAFHDTLDQTLHIGGVKSLGQWQLQFTQTVDENSAPLVETARQTKQQSSVTDISAHYAIRPALALELGVNQNLRYGGSSGNTLEWSTTDWLVYQPSPRLNLGAGASLGYDSLTNAPSQNYQRFGVRTTWRSAYKLSFTLEGGGEVRNTKGTSNSTTTPTFAGSLQYRIFEQTTLTAAAHRSVEVSLFQSQTSQSTGMQFGVRQRLLGKFVLVFDGSRQESKFTASALSVAPGRSDTSRAATLRFEATFRRRGTFALTEELRHNASNLSGYSFDSHQTGLEASFRY
jgi:hypothetical protein